ncbi:MAG: MFS transporter [Bacteroidales bacterium]|nr:MFS transporter [Porphyromonas sp.]MDD6934591.1 MFS transporter [Bacteroidales bacterium]MDY3101859.1 MFS transporter [Porphyromonas sp.]
MNRETPTTAPDKHVKPFIFMVILMALIGFITSLNQQFQTPLKETFLAKSGGYGNTLATFITFSFFLAYLLMGPVSARFLQRNGYKKTLLRGIVIVCISLILFELSALSFGWIGEGPLNHITLGSASLPLGYFIFLLGSFISGTGLTYLQSSVNPYIVVCNVPHTTGVTRQNISGTANSLMTTLVPLFVGWVIFGGKEGSELEVRAILLPMAILIVFVGFLYFGVKTARLPELPNTTVAEGERLEHSVFSFRHLTLGVIGIFMYVGCEVCVGSNIILYAGQDLDIPYEQAVLWASFYWGSMLIGRFLSSFLSMVKANVQLAVSTFCAAVLILLAILLKTPWLLIGVGFFHSLMWGAIFSLSLEGLGKYTARATGVLLMGVVGGAILPLVQGLLADYLHSWTWTWTLVVLGEVYMLYYALFGYRPREIVQ